MTGSSRETARGHTVDVEVRYAETDQMGVVHHANYLVWFELARTGLCAVTGHGYPSIERAGYLILVTGAELRYHRGARYGDRVQVEARLDRLDSRGMRFSYEVRRDGERLAAGSTSHLWVESESGRVRRIPSPWKEAFASLLQPSPQ
jgi:acyl-CoA thioester hydrolase